MLVVRNCLDPSAAFVRRSWDPGASLREHDHHTRTQRSRPFKPQSEKQQPRNSHEFRYMPYRNS